MVAQFGSARDTSLPYKVPGEEQPASRSSPSTQLASGERVMSSIQQSTVEYRLVEGYPIYRVGSDGSVWTKWMPGLRPPKLGNRWRIMKQFRNKPDGYLCVSLSPSAQIKLVHRLVLAAFIGPCPKGMEGCHNDGNKRNNSRSNLRWDTRKNNVGDREKHGTAGRGENHSRAKYTEDFIRAIRRDVAKGMSFEEVGVKFGLSRSYAYQIASKRRWSHVT